MRKLQLVAQGHSSKAIVHQLFISECAVALHLTAIFNKVGVNTRAQLAAVGVAELLAAGAWRCALTAPPGIDRD
jgi:DNA-binding NarL/FixJ family response regulator